MSKVNCVISFPYNCWKTPISAIDIWWYVKERQCLRSCAKILWKGLVLTRIDSVVDWRGYHRTSPVDTLPWLCPRRHGTSQPVPATLSRRLTHINHTRFTVHGRPRSPDNQAKITYPVGVPEASALDGCHFCSARDSTSCFSGRQAQSPQISRFSWSQPTMLWRH